VAAGRDPRGLTVVAGDGATAGTVVDMWLDEPEQMVRYLEIELADGVGTGTRLVPLPMARIKSDRVVVRSIHGEHFGAVPKHASGNQVTLLEEDKISAYYGGGLLYASQARQDPQL
jgi:photosynthetic reaction center H subunit